MSEQWHEIESPGGGLGVVEVRVWAPTFVSYRTNKPEVTRFDVSSVVIADDDVKGWEWSTGDAVNRMSRAMPRELVGIDDEAAVLAAITNPDRPSSQPQYVGDLGAVATLLWVRITGWPNGYGFGAGPTDVGKISCAFGYSPPVPNRAYQILRDAQKVD